jgi:mRNA interferase RelE/StbE
MADLYRLQKKDPRILRDVFAQMLLLERSPNAGEPLLGP